MPHGIGRGMVLGGGAYNIEAPSASYLTHTPRLWHAGPPRNKPRRRTYYRGECPPGGLVPGGGTLGVTPGSIPQGYPWRDPLGIPPGIPWGRFWADLGLAMGNFQLRSLALAEPSTCGTFHWRSLPRCSCHACGPGKMTANNQRMTPGGPPGDRPRGTPPGDPQGDPPGDPPG